MLRGDVSLADVLREFAVVYIAFFNVMYRLPAEDYDEDRQGWRV